ncbi:hypothetical protein ACMA1D_10920 [Streptomyces sp. 796.1]|uniref:hypothetical protein n=1 Tax=Streptomyces sp. 796.1 TaxID=3163029 RepID=UPI0039C9273E
MANNGAGAADESGYALLIAAGPTGKQRAMDAAAALPPLAAVAPTVLLGTAGGAQVVQLVDPDDPQTVLAHLRTAAAHPGAVLVYLVGQVTLDAKQHLPHLALARTTPKTARYTALPWHWLSSELGQRPAGSTTVVADVVADESAWPKVTVELLAAGLDLYGCVSPPPRRRQLSTPHYTRALAGTLRSVNTRPPLPQLHQHVVDQTGFGQGPALLLAPHGATAHNAGGGGAGMAGAVADLPAGFGAGPVPGAVPDFGLPGPGAGLAPLPSAVPLPGVPAAGPVPGAVAAPGAPGAGPVPGAVAAPGAPEAGPVPSAAPAPGAAPVPGVPEAAPDSVPGVAPGSDGSGATPVPGAAPGPGAGAAPGAAPDPDGPEVGPVPGTVAAPRAPGAGLVSDAAPGPGTAPDSGVPEAAPTPVPGAQPDPGAAAPAAAEWPPLAPGGVGGPGPADPGPSAAAAPAPAPAPGAGVPPAPDTQPEAGRGARAYAMEQGIGTPLDPLPAAGAAPVPPAKPVPAPGTTPTAATAGASPAAPAPTTPAGAAPAADLAPPSAADLVAGASAAKPSAVPPATPADDTAARPAAGTDSPAPATPAARPAGPVARPTVALTTDAPATAPTGGGTPGAAPRAGVTAATTRGTGSAVDVPHRPTYAPGPPPAHTPGQAGTAVEAAHDPHGAILEAAHAGRHSEAAAMAAAWEQDAFRSAGPNSPQALHWLEVRADLARLAGDPARACELWMAAATTRLGAGQPADQPDVEGAVDRAHHQWQQVDDPVRARSLATELMTLRTRVPGRRPGALRAIEARLEGLRAARAS